MNKGLLSLALPLFSLSVCSAGESATFGMFQDQNFAPLSRTEDKTYSVTFISNTTFSGRMEITLFNPFLDEPEILYASKSMEAFTSGVPVTRSFVVPFDFVAVNDNTLSFGVLALNGKYAGTWVKKTVTVPYGEPIIGKNPISNATLRGVDCYFAFRNGELIKGHGQYVITPHEKEIYDPPFNKLQMGSTYLTYTNTAYSLSFKGKAKVNLYTCLDQFDVGWISYNGRTLYRNFIGDPFALVFGDKTRIGARLSGQYAVSRQNLVMKEANKLTENDFLSPELFFPVGRGPIDSVYRVRISFEELFDTSDSIYLEFNIHRTSWHFGPSFYSDYCIGIGEGEHV
ncbi:MAG: hypothetical protein MJ239_02725 [Bacilli bacterium]|nr:hypothetical protein [Bacilli bacterium]